MIAVSREEIEVDIRRLGVTLDLTKGLPIDNHALLSMG